MHDCRDCDELDASWSTVPGSGIERLDPAPYNDDPLEQVRRRVGLEPSHLAEPRRLRRGPNAKSFNVNFASLYGRLGEARVRPSNLWCGDEEAREVVEQLNRGSGAGGDRRPSARRGIETSIGGDPGMVNTSTGSRRSSSSEAAR